MNSILSPYLALSCRATSVTGPQTRDWHSCGVENSSATGFLPSTWSNDSLCMSLGGTRVSSSFWLPLTEASVSVATRGGASPTSGIVSACFVVTCTCDGAAMNFSPLLVTASTAHGPFLLNLTCASYTAANGSVS